MQSWLSKHCPSRSPLNTGIHQLSITSRGQNRGYLLPPIPMCSQPCLGTPKHGPERGDMMRYGEWPESP